MYLLLQFNELHSTLAVISCVTPALLQWQIRSEYHRQSKSIYNTLSTISTTSVSTRLYAEYFNNNSNTLLFLTEFKDSKNIYSSTKHVDKHL